MTLQEMFNKVWDHFIVQGNPPGYREEIGRCTYANPACAVGCLMTPSHQEKMKDFQGGVLGVYDHHRDTLEGIVGESLPDYLSCVVPIADYPEKIRFLYDMQGSHDEAAMGYSPTFHETFRVHLTTLADAWLLTVPQEEVAA